MLIVSRARSNERAHENYTRRLRPFGRHGKASPNAHRVLVLDNAGLPIEVLVIPPRVSA
jgi:hypothetical protein